MTEPNQRETDLPAPIINADDEVACPACGSTVFARNATEIVLDEVWGSPGGDLDYRNKRCSTESEKWFCWECDTELSSPADVEGPA